MGVLEMHSIDVPEGDRQAFRLPFGGVTSKRYVTSAACILGTLATISIAAPPNARAQEPGASQRLAAEVLAHPADLDLGYRYAQALLDEGDYAGAAAALERLLMIEPAQPRLRLELGVLYFRLGSYDVAQTYLRRALEMPDLPAPVRERVQYYLDEAERRTRRNQFTGSIAFGGRYQSNANLAAEPEVVRAAGATLRLPPSARPREDVNAYLTGQLAHVYDFGYQTDAALVTNLAGYLTRQTSEAYFNLAGLELVTGPRFAPAPTDLPGVRLRPYIVAGFAAVNDDFYSAAIGPGLDLIYSPAERWSATLSFEGRFASYNSVPRLLDAQFLSGDEKRARLRVGYEIAPGITALGQVTGRDVDTRRAYLDFTEVELTGGLAFIYPAPVAIGDQMFWNVSVSASHFWRDYGGPDPLIDPNVTRSEHEWRVVVFNEIPFAQDWSLAQVFEYQTNDANLPNFDRNNLIVSIGIVRKF